MALADSSNPLLPGSTIVRRHHRPWRHALKIGTPVALVVTLFVILTPNSPTPEATDLTGKPAACSAYKLCKNLAGACCPNGAGVTLDCCRGGLIESTKPEPRPAPAPAPKPRPAAEPEKKEPAPAPKPEAKASPAPVSKPKEKAAPSPAKHPTVTAVELAAAPAACSAYKLCKNLAGECCPNGAGVTLDCCRGGLIETTKPEPRPAPAPAPRPRPAAEPEKKEPAPAPKPEAKASPAPASKPEGKVAPSPAKHPKVDENRTLLQAAGGVEFAYLPTCASHPNCVNFNAGGNCCPDAYGYYMTCCDGPPVKHTGEKHEDVDFNSDNPNYGCGLLGSIPGINLGGHVSAGTQQLLDGLKSSSTFKKVSFWNYKPAPDDKQYLSDDFIFMPENWGMAGFTDTTQIQTPGANPQFRPYISNLFLQTNEPDIQGSCMGDVMGYCTANCPPGVPNGAACPVADLLGTVPKHANAQGQCNCWQFSQATGAGFWSLGGCKAPQPLPTLFDGTDPGCVDTVMNGWKAGAAAIASKGYKFLTSPLIAQNMEWGKTFIEKACGCVGGQCSCTSIECGCPQYFAFHFYAYDCQPDLPSGYKAFQDKLDFVKNMMEEYSFLKGAIINEVGLLNCADQQHGAPICVPNTGTNKAENLPNHACPNTAAVIEHLMDQVMKSKTKDGRDVVKGFTWFNENMDGGTYNLQLFDPDGSVNAAGKAYMTSCEKWAQMQSN